MNDIVPPTSDPTSDLASDSSIHLPIVIDCGTCVMRRTAACQDCMMTALFDDDASCDAGRDLGRPGRDGHDDVDAGVRSGERGAVVFDLVEYRAVRLLADAGLVPSLRHREAENTG